MVLALREVLRQEAGRSPAIDARVSRAVVIGFSWATGAAGMVWGVILMLLGEPSASLYPFGYTVGTSLNALAYLGHRRQSLQGGIQIGLILVVPAALTLHLGGLLDSGAVGLWSLLAPVGALLVFGPRLAIATFVAFVGLMALTVWVESFPVEPATLQPGVVAAFLFLNVVGVSVVAFWATRAFLGVSHELAEEQQRRRQAEQAYVAQEAMLRQRDKLATLGKLSAGVAHELNNPAAAASRVTGHLEEVVRRLIDHAMGMLESDTTPDSLTEVRAAAKGATPSDPLAMADHEERIASWLERAGVPDPWEVASDLAALGFDVSSLETAVEHYQERQVMAALRWLVDVWRAEQLIVEMRVCTSRISDIVDALKGYSHMDRAEMVAVDVEKGIDDTLTVLRDKVGSMEVVRHRAELVPALAGHPGELNQVWTNLIANAAEAATGEGTLTIRTFSADGQILVEVEDDGPGIPPELVDQVFDPFVTTKSPGEGTGLGLTLAYQIVVDRHGGAITVESRPGCTRFVVSLPAEA